MIKHAMRSHHGPARCALTNQICFSLDEKAATEFRTFVCIYLSTSLVIVCGFDGGGAAKVGALCLLLPIFCFIISLFLPLFLSTLCLSLCLCLLSISLFIFLGVSSSSCLSCVCSYRFLPSPFSLFSLFSCCSCIFPSLLPCFFCFSSLTSYPSSYLSPSVYLSLSLSLSLSLLEQYRRYQAWDSFLTGLWRHLSWGLLNVCRTKCVVSMCHGRKKLSFAV